MNQQVVFASAQIITLNPIMKEPADIRAQYYAYLKNLIRLTRWNKRKYTKAQLTFYRDKLCEGGDVPHCSNKRPFAVRFCYLIPFDLAILLGFHSKMVNPQNLKIFIDKMVSDFSLSYEQSVFLYEEFKAVLGEPSAWDVVLGSNSVRSCKTYLKSVKQNIDFISKAPYKMLITATMSAGKSTLINALVGKNISLAQNMACTSKIHVIVSKPFDDGFTSEYDHVLSIDASREDLLNDNEENKSFRITVGTHFDGLLAGKRLVLYDSPGVNSSENAEHTEITARMIKSKKYRLLLYVLNSTQLSTTDEEHHLETVKGIIGRARVIFILNKADQLITDDESITKSIENQRKFLASKGFKNPVICPVSSRAAYLAKRSCRGELSWYEQRELQNFIDKFEFSGLPEYYQTVFGRTPISTQSEEQALLANCGFTYLEQIITDYINGGI